MRIAFMGKGGSGKTTITASFTKFLSNRHPNQPIYLFDADLNCHLAQEFNQLTSIQFAKKFTDIAKILEPNLLTAHPTLPQIPEFGTLPANPHSNFIHLSTHPTNQLSKNFGQKINNITLFTVGNHLDRKSGHTCYHDMLNSYELILHRLIDDNSSYIIADTTAGIDNLGTSLYLAYDLIIFVIEPTERSIKVYQDYIKIPDATQTPILVIANKIESPEDLSYIKSKLPQTPIIGAINFNPDIYRSTTKNHQSFIEENQAIFQTILDTAKSQEKNWPLYFKKIYTLFQKESQGWWSQFYGINLEEIFPSNFTPNFNNQINQNS